MNTEKSGIEPAKSPAKSTWTRRRFLKATALGLIGSGAAAGLYANQIEPHWVDIVRRDMPIENLPGSLNEKTLIQISDLHIGPVVDDDYMRDALGLVSQLKPDILAITGDLMTYRVSGRSRQNDQPAEGSRRRPTGNGRRSGQP